MPNATGLIQIKIELKSKGIHGIFYFKNIDKLTLGKMFTKSTVYNMPETITAK